MSLAVGTIALGLCGKILIKFNIVFLFASSKTNSLGSVLGHGNIVWPPAWQDANGTFGLKSGQINIFEKKNCIE